MKNIAESGCISDNIKNSMKKLVITVIVLAVLAGGVLILKSRLISPIDISSINQEEKNVEGLNNDISVAVQDEVFLNELDQTLNDVENGEGVVQSGAALDIASITNEGSVQTIFWNDLDAFNNDSVAVDESVNQASQEVKQ